MGLFDGVLGGIVGAEMATLVNNLIAQHGGLPGLVSHFERQGLGPTVQSWVGNGPNKPITPDQLQQALGSETMQKLAAAFGVSPQEAAAKLSAVLPQVVDHLTPTGTVKS
ncbi:MAG: YidB family protein [Vicinamibacterales bacterium]